MLGARILYVMGCLLIFCGLAAGAFVRPAAAAGELDPFQIENGHWMSFERYSDNIKRNRPVGAETPVAIEAPTLAVAGDEKPMEPAADSAGQPGLAEESMPAVAAPQRPLNLPTLPGVNKGFNLQVESTAENKTAAPPAQIVQTSDGASDLQLQARNWQEATEIARARSDRASAVRDPEHSPLDVRMSFLPNPKVVPVGPDEKKPRTHYLAMPATQKPPEEAKTAAECAAVDTYKKKQLEAIQSDRETLQALQSAIADLGLQKQLSFMTGGQTPIRNASSEAQPSAMAPAATQTP